VNTARIDSIDGVTDDVLRELATVLVDAVSSGASVSFMPDLRFDEAVEWWRKTFSTAPSRTVVAKLIVHRRARGRGIARALMQELERRARDQRFTLLVLDTCKGSAAEKLYSSLGWVRVGEIPHYALNPDGTPCDTVFFYKQL